MSLFCMAGFEYRFPPFITILSGFLDGRAFLPAVALVFLKHTKRSQDLVGPIVLRMLPTKAAIVPVPVTANPQSK